MKNKEIEELLNEMKDNTLDYVGTNGCLYQDLERKELNLLLSYIEQLDLENKFAKEYEKNYRETYKKYKQLEIKNDVLIGKKLIEKDKNANEIKIKAFKNKDYINELQKKNEQLEKDKQILIRNNNIGNERLKELQNINKQLENKYDKALETLVDFNMPCERDDFNLLDTDYCELNCSNDDEQYKKCWNRWIEWRLENETNKRNVN